MSRPRARNAGEDRLFHFIKTVARHSLVYGFFDVLGRATSLLLLPLYTNVMSPPEYGVLEIFTVTQALLQSLLLFGFNSALVRYYSGAATPGEGTRYFHTSLATVTLFAGSALLGLFLAAGPADRLVFGGESAGSGLWRLLALAVFFDVVWLLFLSLFRAQGRPFRYSWVNLARFVVALGGNVYWVGIERRGIEGALLGNLAGSVAGALLGLAIARRETRFEFDAGSFRRLLGFGAPLMLGAMALFVMNSSDRFFLKGFASLEELGVYGLGYKIGLIMSLLMNAFVVAWLPVMYRIAKEERAREIFARVLTYYVLVAGTVLLGIASFRHEIVGVLSGPGYEGAAAFVPLILLSYLFQGVHYIYSVGLVVTDRVRWVPVVTGGAAMVNIVLNLVLIPKLGAMGAAWATFLSFGAMTAGMWFASQRFYPIRFENRRLLTLVAFGGLVLFATGRIGHASTGDLVLKLGAVALFPVMLYLTRFFSEEELLRARLFLERGKARVSG